MNESTRMRHGTVTERRDLAAPRPLVYDAWTALEHRRVWFKGPQWTEIERSVDLCVGGTEIAHGRFDETGIETIYTARFHLVEPPVRLVYAFDMHVAGEQFSVSLTGVEFEDVDGGTRLTYTEDGFFLQGEYDESGRAEGTRFLLDQFAAYLATLG